MRFLQTTAMATACVGIALAAGPSQVQAHPRCQKINATIYDRVVAEGCPPPTQVCVVGTVKGEDDFTGTTVFVLGSRSDPPPTSPGYRAVSGTITYTFKDGSTLTALETSIGNVDTATGSGHAGGTQEFTAGTGRYAGATGYTYLGQRWEVDHFVTRILGEVCAART